MDSLVTVFFGNCRYGSVGEDRIIARSASFIARRCRGVLPGHQVLDQMEFAGFDIVEKTVDIHVPRCTA